MKRVSSIQLFELKSGEHKNKLESLFFLIFCLLNISKTRLNSTKLQIENMQKEKKKSFVGSIWLLADESFILQVEEEDWQIIFTYT